MTNGLTVWYDERTNVSKICPWGISKFQLIIRNASAMLETSLHEYKCHNHAAIGS